MKKILLLSALSITALTANAQVVNDSVLTGASYANQVWYSLANDEQGSAPKENWDIAFHVNGMTSSIHINSIIGTTLWGYPGSDISGWSGVDTTGLSTWMMRYNSDTSWSFGAMGNYADLSNFADLDWGIYDMTTHIVTGDSIYIIKLANGDYKKLAIESLASGVFTFKYADLDGNNEVNATITKSNFTGKNFAYYSIQNDAALQANREPDAVKWDLLFTQYTAFIPQPYTVFGVLHNSGVNVAKATGLADETTYTNYAAHTFAKEINTIGYNWKSHIGGGVYSVKDSTAYFVKTKNGSIWKVLFTAFSSADGKSVFSKEALVTVGINDADSKAEATMALYPNPSVGQQAVTIVYNFEHAVKAAELSVYDMSGKMVHKGGMSTTEGLHQYQLPATFAPGAYVVMINTDMGKMQQKLILQ